MTRVIIIGAGITGAMAALDLSLRGAEVVLVERYPEPAGATTKIGGVVHGGARFAAINRKLASACRDENRIMRNLARDFLISDGGYFLKLADDDQTYYDSFIAGVNSLGIAAREVSPSEIGGNNLKTDGIEVVLETSDILINLHDFLKQVIYNAIKNGAVYINSTDLIGAEKAGEGYTLHFIRNSEKIDLSGYVINAAGTGIPAVFERITGKKLETAAVQGSHIILRGKIDRIMQLISKPAAGDIFVPTNSGIMVGPTQVDMPRGEPRITDMEKQTLLKSASRILYVNNGDLIGWVTTSRLLYSQIQSKMANDLLASLDGVINAYSSTMTCGRLVGEEAANVVAGLLDLRRGPFTRNYVVEKVQD